MTARSIEHLIIGELLSGLPPLLAIELLLRIIIPRRVLPRPWAPLLLSFHPRTLAATRALLVLLYGRHLVRTISIVWRIPLPKMLHRSLLVGSGPHIGSADWFGRKGRLHWVTQGIHISDLDSFS